MEALFVSAFECAASVIYVVAWLGLVVFLLGIVFTGFCFFLSKVSLCVIKSKWGHKIIQEMIDNREIWRHEIPKSMRDDFDYNRSW